MSKSLAPNMSCHAQAPSQLRFHIRSVAISDGSLSSLRGAVLPSCRIGLVPLEYAPVSPIRFGPSALSPPSSYESTSPSLRHCTCKGKLYRPPPLEHWPGTSVISSRPLQMPLALPPFSKRVPLINILAASCAYAYAIYTFCFCLKISASLCRANDVSCIFGNCGLRPKRDLRFLSFRQRGTTFFGSLLTCRFLLRLLAILLSLVTACGVPCRQLSSSWWGHKPIALTSHSGGRCGSVSKGLATLSPPELKAAG